MSNRTRSVLTDPATVLVVAQTLAGASIAWPGRARWRLPRVVTTGALAVGAVGSSLAVAGARALGRDLTSFVEPRDGAQLRTRGIYRFSRNPVYVGLLMAGAGAAVARRRPEPLLGFAALAAVLHVKVGIEERRLADRFGAAYADYTARTPRLLGLPAGR